MKKIITLIFGLSLVYSCSTSNDGNGNSTSTVVPVAPSNLTGVVASTTQINLSWIDNSTNETGFKIERKTGSGTFAVVGTTSVDVTTFNDSGLTPSSTYTYRIYSYNTGGNSPTYSNEITLSINITTSSITSITSCTAISGATITGYVGSTITARGVCWSTSINPTIALATRTTDGIGTGSFVSNITGLTANTIYFIRAYVTTSIGTDYGNEISFTTLSSNVPDSNLIDIDGNVYSTSTYCGEQTWMKSNLNVSRYRNGDIIPQVTDSSQWKNLTTGAWCYYNNDPANGAIYGKLYNWYAINDPRKLAPIGYHIPTDGEWSSLTTCLGGNVVAGGALKEAGTSHWISPNTIATNTSGFTSLPGGLRSYLGGFNSINMYGYWWSATLNGTTWAWTEVMKYNSGESNKGAMDRKSGAAVRCVKD